MPDDEDLIGDEGEILLVSMGDAQRLRHCCARASMVMIGEELKVMLSTVETERCFISDATLKALRVSMAHLDTEEMNESAAKYALRVSSLASSLSWPSNSEIGPERCDA